MKKEFNKTKFKNKNKQKNIDKKKIAEKIRKIIFLLLLLSFVGVTFWALFFSPLTKIKRVEVDGYNSGAASESIQSVISDKYLNSIPKDNLLLLPKGKIEEDIKEKLILAKNIEINRKFPDGLKVNYDKRQKVITWCRQEGGDECFLIDDSGEAFLATKNKENFPIVFDHSNTEINVGEKHISVQLVGFCHEIANQVEQESSLKIIPEYSTPSFVSGEIRAQTESGFKVFFNTEAEAYKQAKLLESVVENDIGKENLSKLEYIDLRLEGKVIYKEKGSEKDEDNGDDGDS